MEIIVKLKQVIYWATFMSRGRVTKRVLLTGPVASPDILNVLQPTSRHLIGGLIKTIKIRSPVRS
jgi:hypothetical protein